jgi:K+-sensing histidine kinase KdpD
MKQQLNTEDKLFSKFSHDLRGSFVSILGYTELLSDPNEKVTSQEINEFVNRIDFRTKEVYELLNNFINWLKLEKYNKKLAIEENSLLDSITEAQFYFNKTFKEKSVNIVSELKGISKVFIDLQVLQGILKNIFLFISKNILKKSSLKVHYVNYTKNVVIKFEFLSHFEEHQKLALSTLKANNIDIPNIPNEILFAEKFIELSNGKFELVLEKDSKVKLIISLPKEKI